MKFTTTLFVLILSSTSFAKETVLINFTNGTVELEADIQMSESNDGFTVKNVSLNLAGEKHGSLYLVSEFGWGDSPYSLLCEQISLIKYGHKTFKFPTAYGFATTFNLFSGFLSKKEFFIVNRDKSFLISDTYPNSVYDSGFACYDKELVY